MFDAHREAEEWEGLNRSEAEQQGMSEPREGQLLNSLSWSPHRHNCIIEINPLTNTSSFP
jgi:hypothetical protein